ncbi:MAG TPA: DUF3667 domain-containing protein, partial [Flavobacterium sp.]
MSNHSIRTDKTCLNCYYVVENRFCPNCGQENIETRKTFHHLFFHFIEDLTHYENSFWKTIRNLLFKPASLTKEYLSGKRMSYLAPVRLYIFISFITFLFIAIGPDSSKDTININDGTKGGANFQFNSPATLDTVTGKSENILKSGRFGYASVAEFDSIQKYGSDQDKLPPYLLWVARKAIVVAEKNTGTEIADKFTTSFTSNLPKVLFIYMPIFALVLWLFQSKKKWYYFDHGIFTLHYFSFLLLVYFVLSIMETILRMISDHYTIEIILGFIHFIGVAWMFYYFFPAHHRFYGETRIMSVIKGSVMFIINLFFIFLILVLFA